MSEPADGLEPEIENKLDPGRFVSDLGCFRFVGGLEQVSTVARALRTSHAVRNDLDAYAELAQSTVARRASCLASMTS